MCDIQRERINDFSPSCSKSLSRPRIPVGIETEWSIRHCGRLKESNFFTNCKFAENPDIDGNDMAKSRIRPSSLAKLFENSPVLAYVLNLDLEIVYANPSCAQWVGSEVEQLIGQRCIYTSSELDNETKNRIRGLCPPPEIAQTLAIETTIFCEDRFSSLF